MEILFILFVIIALAFDVVFFIEIEKILDNTFDIGSNLVRFRRQLLRKRGKK